MSLISWAKKKTGYNILAGIEIKTEDIYANWHAHTQPQNKK